VAGVRGRLPACFPSARPTANTGHACTIRGRKMRTCTYLHPRTRKHDPRCNTPPRVHCTTRHTRGGVRNATARVDILSARRRHTRRRLRGGVGAQGRASTSTTSRCSRSAPSSAASWVSLHPPSLSAPPPTPSPFPLLRQPPARGPAHPQPPPAAAPCRRRRCWALMQANESCLMKAAQ
jgi:hypothetical protein